ncbi:MAG: hypothetical protein QW189_08715 [Thermofilaceae archaeon]
MDRLVKNAKTFTSGSNKVKGTLPELPLSSGSSSSARLDVLA